MLGNNSPAISNFGDVFDFIECFRDQTLTDVTLTCISVADDVAH